MLHPSIRALFDSPGDGHLLVITVGNALRSDDGVGPAIARGFRPGPGRPIIINAGERPECVLSDAGTHRPNRIVIIDAADFGGQPGEARLLPPEAIPDRTLSTHTFPLPIIARVLGEDTGASVHFLGIQPASVAFGESLSPEVAKTAREITLLVNAGQRSVESIQRKVNP